MEILFLTQLLPYPLNTGGKVKTFQILKILGRNHNIHLISLVDKAEDLSGEGDLRFFCKTMKTFVVPVVTKQHKKLMLKIFFSFFNEKPFIVYKFYSQQIKNYINNFIKARKIDLLYIDHINMAQYIPPWYRSKVVYDEHNISYIAYSRYAQAEENIIKKTWFWIENKKLEFFEKKWIDRFTHIFSISKLDKKRLIELGSLPKNVSFLPIPFATIYLFQPDNNSFIITFVAMLSWRPNEKGIIWFITNVWPLIKKMLPQVQLKIAGKNGEEIESYLKKINDASIKYLGYVDDLTKLYKETAVFISPILMGGGIRIKLLEAMSHGLPVVSTSFGAEGIEVKNERNVLIADTPEDFANAVIKVIKDKKLALTLSKNGFNFMKKYYNEKETEKALKILNKI